jgi:hypothetical protein
VKGFLYVPPLCLDCGLTDLFKTLLIAGTVALTTISAAKADLIVNGGFESKGFNGWSTSFSGGTNPVVIQYQASGYPTGAFGEAVPAPVNGGTYGAYFSSDTGTDTITEIINVTPGKYVLSFDVYAPSNGRANPFDALFDGSVFPGPSDNGTAKTLPAGWSYISVNFTVATAGRPPLVLSSPG